MANRVSVNVNVNDLSRAGIRSLNNNLRNLRRQLPDDHIINLTLNDGNAFNRAGRLNRALRNLPDDVRVNVRTTGPDRADRNRMVRSLQRGLTSPFRVMGATLGGLLSDGIGQGIIGAFRAAGPAGMAILAAAILGFVSMIGAALAGLLVFALGAAFVGIGAISAAKSKEVKEQWASTLEALKPLFKSVGEPMIPVLTNGLKLLEQMATKAAPILRDALVAAAPATEEFFKKFGEGFERFAEGAFQPIMDAWEVFSPIFGDVWSDFMADLGENFGDLGKLVRENSFEIEIALRMVFKILSGLVEVVEFFASAWVMQIAIVGEAVGILVNSIIVPMGEAILTAFEGIIRGAANAFGWIPGLGPQLKEAADKFGTFKEDTLGKLRDMGDAAAGANEKIDRLNKTRVLKADIKSWNASLADARAKLKQTTDQKARAKLTADIKDLEAKIKRAKGQLDSLNGRTSNMYLRINVAAVGARNAKNLAGFAHGGVRGVSAAATGGVRSNMTLVGEQGPEIVSMAPGSRVRSNPDTRRLMGKQGSAGAAAQFLFKSSGRRVDDLLLEILREAIHQRGGDPVQVLGG
jgi:hypothetical protein